MKLRTVSFLLLLMNGFAFGQGFIHPLNDFFKDNTLRLSKTNVLNSLYPTSGNDLDLSHLNRDSTVVYSDLSDRIYKKNVFQFKNKVGYIVINPMINLSKGKNYLDTNKFNLNRNARGLYFEGRLFDNFSFNFGVSENQSIFQTYEREYMSSRGESYVFGGGKYSVQNAVVPGGSRTKPFKVNGYDYAYSFGMMRLDLHKKFAIEAGNNKNFVGSGYRSLLLSDNSFYSPTLRLQWNISPELSYQVIYKKQLNLFRKPITKAVEGEYESKLFSANYLTFKPVKSFSISLFSSGIQLEGDSLISHGFVAKNILPLPFIQNDILFNQPDYVNGISGLNIDLAFNNIRIYSQLAIDKVNDKLLSAYQAGAYFFDPFKIKKALIQFECNYVPKNFYASNSPKNAYSNFNLPLAHPKGNNFLEFFVKMSYEYKRLYFTAKSDMYITEGGTMSQHIQANSIFSLSNVNASYTNGFTFYEDVELGYRLNRKYNGTIFLGFRGRAAQYHQANEAIQSIWFGVKTGLSNEYLDF
jgi:hypothetical protein